MSEIDDDLILVSGIQAMKGFLYMMSAIIIPFFWLASSAPPLESVSHNVAIQVVWGVVEIMSCIFALIPTRKSHIILAFVILLPGIGLLFTMLLAILYWLVLYGVLGLSLFYIIGIFATPFLALTSSLYFIVNVFLGIIEVLLLWHYFQPLMSSLNR